jgi:bud site selection protein 31
MPPVRTARASKKAPPEGFDDIEDTLLEFANKMKDAENASGEGKKKYEAVWPVFQITHQRSRYIYDLYYEKEAIGRPLYEWLLKNGYADAGLIAKWKKQGYEKVCYCSRCLCETAQKSGGGGMVKWRMLTVVYSFAAYGVSRPRRRISDRRVFAGFRARSSRRIRIYSV